MASIEKKLPKEVHREEVKNGNTSYKSVDVTPVAIEKSVLEKARSVKVVEVSFPYRDIRILDDLTGYQKRELS